MDVLFKVKNFKKAMSPNKDDILIFDGKLWYITSKKDIFGEYDKKIAQMAKEREQLVSEINKFKKEIAEQMLNYGTMIREFITKGEE